MNLQGISARPVHCSIIHNSRGNNLNFHQWTNGFGGHLFSTVLNNWLLEKLLNLLGIRHCHILSMSWHQGNVNRKAVSASAFGILCGFQWSISEVLARAASVGGDTEDPGEVGRAIVVPFDSSLLLYLRSINPFDSRFPDSRLYVFLR